MGLLSMDVMLVEKWSSCSLVTDTDRPPLLVFQKHL
jgi:hypothetical protein